MESVKIWLQKLVPGFCTIVSRIVHLISALHTYQIGRRLDVLDILFDLETQLVHGTERPQSLWQRYEVSDFPCMVFTGYLETVSLLNLKK